jgi:hypothetical protein
MQSNRTATRYPQHASRAQLQDEAQPQADASSAPDNPHWDSKERPRQLSGTQSRATSLCDEASNASCTTRNRTSRYRNQLQTAYGSDAQSRHSVSKPRKMRGSTEILYKLYGVHSMQSIDACYIYNPVMRCWISRETGEPISELRRAGIEFALREARDLDWRGADNSEVLYYCGHWLPANEAAELRCQKFWRQDEVLDLKKVKSQRLEDMKPGCFGKYSNRDVDCLYMFHPMHRHWVHRSTGEKVGPAVMLEIKHKLAQYGDLNYSGYTNTSVMFNNGQWYDLSQGVSPNTGHHWYGKYDESRHTEAKRLSSATAVKESTEKCHDKATAENKPPFPKPLALCPLENKGGTYVCAPNFETAQVGASCRASRTRRKRRRPCQWARCQK